MNNQFDEPTKSLAQSATRRPESKNRKSWDLFPRQARASTVPWGRDNKGFEQEITEEMESL